MPAGPRGGRSPSRHPTSGSGVPPSRASPTWTVCGCADGDDVPGRRQAVVPHPLRPRQPVGGPDAAAAGHRPRAGTLRVLARRQGTPDDPETGEAARQDPARAAPADSAARRARRLPPVYYGTVDATPLGSACCTTPGAGACRPARSSELLPHARGGAGLAARVRRRGRRRLPRVHRPQRARGLANQGWKDSGDAVRFARRPARRAADRAGRGAGVRLPGGRSTAPPCWTRSAGPAATGGASGPAALRERFRGRVLGRGRPGPTRRSRWTATGAPVDSLTSNIGHLLGTGLLDGGGGARGRRRARPRRTMSGGYGLRTMAADAPRLRPLVVPLRLGLGARHRDRGARAWPARGHRAEAARAGRRAARRPPRRSTTGCPSCTAARPRPPADAGRAYPAACRPQAWSAAAAAARCCAALGLRPDVPAGTVTHPARTRRRCSARSRCAGSGWARSRLDVHVAADGVVRVEPEPDSALTVSDPGGR